MSNTPYYRDSFLSTSDAAQAMDVYTSYLHHPMSASSAYINQPPPPPPPGILQGSNGDVNGGYRGLNVVDPRFAAKYGNPYLVQNQQQGQAQLSQTQLSQTQLSYPSPRQQKRQLMIPHNNNHQRGYATLNARGNGAAGFQPQQHQKKVNYAGTMIGNGSLGRGVKNGSSSSNKSKYIIPPESSSAEVKSGALATHV